MHHLVPLELKFNLDYYNFFLSPQSIIFVILFFVGKTEIKKKNMIIRVSNIKILEILCDLVALLMSPNNRI